jgi:formylmethanofuran dehydrogenase subunit E
VRLDNHTDGVFWLLIIAGFFFCILASAWLFNHSVTLGVILTVLSYLSFIVVFVEGEPEAASKVGENMKCDKCGEELNQEGDRFWCPRCGANYEYDGR